LKGKPHGKVQLDDLMVLSDSRGVNAPRLQNTHHVVAPAKGKSKLLSEKRELAPRNHTHTHTHTLTHKGSPRRPKRIKGRHVPPRYSGPTLGRVSITMVTERLRAAPPARGLAQHEPVHFTTRELLGDVPRSGVRTCPPAGTHTLRTASVAHHPALAPPVQ
jgi:hypothetical protein